MAYNYDWESKVNQSVIAEMQSLLPKGFELAGVAVVNTDTCEAAIVTSLGYAPSGSVSSIDIWQDIETDANYNADKCRSLGRA